MALIARIFGVSLLAAGLGVVLGVVFFPQGRDAVGIWLLLACVGSVVGALAGTANEIVTASRQKPSI